MYKCNFCDCCLGEGCVGQLPGMGGVNENKIFMRNCRDYDKYQEAEGFIPEIRLAPITGAVQNVGYLDEESFYADFIGEALDAGLKISIGDGYPDEKLQFGIAALQKYGVRGAVFIKPYPEKQFFDRMEWCRIVASHIGVDIDSYNILTMRDLVKLEQKSASQLQEISKRARVPFIIKGIFSEHDVRLVEEVRPDIAVVSNHGGRVNNSEGSTIDFLVEYGSRIAKAVGEVWMDGGIRKHRDLGVCARYGVKEVMIGRPAITALLKGRGELKKYITVLR